MNDRNYRGPLVAATDPEVGQWWINPHTGVVYFLVSVALCADDPHCHGGSDSDYFTVSDETGDVSPVSRGHMKRHGWRHRP